MRFDSFLSYPRWEILQILATHPSSPIELAKKLKTTVAYMSQQLKLLDAAGLVSSTKTGASEKGKPRVVFHVSEELIYIASLTHSFAGKKLIKANDHHKAITTIWAIEDVSLHSLFVKFYLEIENYLNELEAIFIDTSFISPKFLIITESKKIKDKLDAFTKQLPKKPDFLIIQKSNLKKQIFSEKILPIHDPLGIINQMKGGLNEIVNGND